MNRQSHDASVDEAARWYARLNSPACTAADREAFDAWCRLDPANARNFAAARRLAEDLFGTISADERLQAMTREALEMGTKMAPESRSAPERIAVPRRPWAVAAGFAVCLVSAIATIAMLDNDPGALPPQIFAAGAETRQIVLDDGSRVHLDVRSRLEIRYSPVRREVTLEKGRAIFDVAKDPDRPFSVATPLGVVTALGTRFEVRQDDTLVVTLAEGSVSVAADASHKEYLQPGDQLLIAADTEHWVKRRVDVDAETGWSQGRLTFRNERLADVVAQVNRYSAAKVRIADSSLSELPVSGSFVAGDGHSAVAAFAAVLPIRVADGGDELLLFRRWEPASISE